MTKPVRFTFSTDGFSLDRACRSLSLASTFLDRGSPDEGSMAGIQREMMELRAFLERISKAERQQIEDDAVRDRIRAQIDRQQAKRDARRAARKALAHA